MGKSVLCFTLLLVLALGAVARRCPLLHAPESANKTGCYIIVLYKNTTQEKFDEILRRAASVAEGNKVYGQTKNVTKAIVVKLSAYSLNLVCLKLCTLYGRW